MLHRRLTKFLHSALFLAIYAAPPSHSWAKLVSSFILNRPFGLPRFLLPVVVKRYPGVIGQRCFLSSKKANPLLSSVSKGSLEIDLLTLNIKLTIKADPPLPFLNVNPIFSFLKILYRTTRDLTTVFSDRLLERTVEQRLNSPSKCIDTVHVKRIIITCIPSVNAYVHYLYPQSSIENATNFALLPLWPPCIL